MPHKGLKRIRNDGGGQIVGLCHLSGGGSVERSFPNPLKQQ
jgi:hypothetical protein